MRPTGRTLTTILVVTIAEVAWTLFAARAGVELAVYYAVLVVASAVFFIPGIAEEGAGSAQERLARTAETSG